MDARTFRRTCAKFSTGIVIASVADADGNPHGMTVNSFTSVSADPPLVLICVDQASRLLPLFRASGRYGLSILAHQQQKLSTHFAQPRPHRSSAVDWESGKTGVPLIPGALAHMECAIRTTVEAGDHTILIAEVISADIGEGKPLIYFDSGYRLLE